MYEYKFDKIKGKSYPSAERIMHYYENHSDEPPRELILKLGKKITDIILLNIGDLRQWFPMKWQRLH